jgi:ADP-ribose pyrophosphatase YjhB (NUDIX family)
MKSVFATAFRLLPRGVLRWSLFLANAKFNHGAVGVYQDAQGRVLVLHHVFRRSYPWGFPSGFVEVGENADTAALRELKEETGLTAEIDHVGPTQLVAKRHLETLVYGRADSTQDIKISPEIFEARWVMPGQVPDDVARGLLPAHRVLLSRSLKLPRSNNT